MHRITSIEQTVREMFPPGWLRASLLEQIRAERAGAHA